MQTRSMGMRLAPRLEKEIDALVEDGLYLSRGEVIREAIREKLQSREALELRHLSKGQARQEILEYLKTHGHAWTSDIAKELRLDLDLVLAVLKELRERKEVAPHDHA